MEKNAIKIEEKKLSKGRDSCSEYPFITAISFFRQFFQLKSCILRIEEK